jgi:two-component system cell cycle response regulator
MYLVHAADGTYESGGWFDAGWWGGLFLIALAAWQRPPRGRRRCADDSLRLIAAPLVSGAVGLELLLYASTGHLNAVAVALAAASLVFVMIRLTLTFRQNVRMLRTSRNEALTDALTGLGNRRALTRALDDALPDVQREAPLVLALFDLDGFKHYNDTVGHPAGDVLLARLGRNLKAFLDGRGHAFRMGGDEFCVLLDPRGEDPTLIVEGAAHALSEHGDGFWIGCSYGAVTLPNEATESDEALRIADQRMYAQKNAGRMSASRQAKDVLLTALLEHDGELIGRVGVVSELAEAIARHLAVDRDEREAIRIAAELRGVGALIGRENDVLAAARILAASPALAPAAALVRASREHWDGSGFPDGLARHEIPLGARIVAVAAAAHPEAGAGTRLDPAVVEALLAVRRTPAVV